MRAPIPKHIDNVYMCMAIDHKREISLQVLCIRFQQRVSPWRTFSRGRVRVCVTCLGNFPAAGAAWMFTVSDGVSLLLCFLCERPMRNVDFV